MANPFESDLDEDQSIAYAQVQEKDVEESRNDSVEGYCELSSDCTLTIPPIPKSGNSRPPSLNPSPVPPEISGSDNLGMASGDHHYEDAQGSPTTTSLRYSNQVQGTIDKLMPSDDPMYRPDFDVVAHINSLFPTEQSLANIDDVIGRISGDIEGIDGEISQIVHEQGFASERGHVALTEAKEAIQELFTRIREIKSKTDTSEVMVKEITRDIKQLDTAKKNLTSSIATLNHLHLLLSSLESLECFTRNKQYSEIANLLPGVMKVLEHFEKYMHIAQVSELNGKVDKIRRELGELLKMEFKNSVAGGRPFTPIAHMGEACKVISELEPSVKAEIVAWFVDLQLHEYRLLYDESQDNAWLDKIDQRYGWFKKMLTSFEEKLNHHFPTDWDMPERISLTFCEITAKDLSAMMSKRRVELSANLLKFAIERTMAFENLLMRRFPNSRVAGSGTPSVPTDAVELENREVGQNSAPTNIFSGSIRKCFDGHLQIFTADKDSNLAKLLEEKVQQAKLYPPRSDQEIGAINLQSSSDLFLAYKNCIREANDLGLSNLIHLQLVGVFKKYLRDYSKRCLSDFLPKISTQNASNTSGLIQSLLKEGDVPKLTKEEQYRTCCILITAEYCADTTKNLQDNLLKKVGPDHKDNIDMSPEQDGFYSVVSSCVHILVQDLEGACDPALAVLSKKQVFRNNSSRKCSLRDARIFTSFDTNFGNCWAEWSNISSVGDESQYVLTIKAHLRQNVPRIRDYLITARKYFIAFCTKFANSFCAKFVASLLRLRSLSITGAEQLLLDAHSLKAELLNLPNLESKSERKAPANYTKLVVKGMTKAEMILKVVMSSESMDTGNTSFVESTQRLLPDCSVHEFQQILELIGLPRAKQTVLIDNFTSTQKSAGDSSQNVTGKEHLLSGSRIPELGGFEISPDVAAAVAADSRIKKLHKLLKR